LGGKFLEIATGGIFRKVDPPFNVPTQTVPEKFVGKEKAI